MIQLQQHATQTLIDFRRGDSSAIAKLLPLIYDELHRLAISFMKRQRPDHTLQPTALVHEVYLKLIDQTRTGSMDRTHFMAIAATAMRQILINHAKKKKASKRGGGRQRLTLDNAVAPTADREIDLIALEEALTKLDRLNARQCRVVEMRFFAGMTIEETAQALGVGTTTVGDDWHLAKAWLAREISEDGEL